MRKLLKSCVFHRYLRLFSGPRITRSSWTTKDVCTRSKVSLLVLSKLTKIAHICTCLVLGSSSLPVQFQLHFMISYYVNFLAPKSTNLKYKCFLCYKKLFVKWWWNWHTLVHFYELLLLSKKHQYHNYPLETLVIIRKKF